MKKEACECSIEKKKRKKNPVKTRLSAEKSTRDRRRRIIREDDKKYRIRLISTANNDDLTTPYPNHQELLDRSNIRT